MDKPKRPPSIVQSVLAGNRLIGEGMPIDQVNEYLRKTPKEQMVKENLDHLQKQRLKRLN